MSWLWSKLVSWWPVAFILTPFGTLLVAVSFLVDIPAMLHSLHLQLVAANSHIHALDFGSWYAIANRLVPLNEMIGMATILLSVRLLAASIRAVKSLIPTIS